MYKPRSIVFLGGRVHRGLEEKAPRPMEFEYASCLRPQTAQYLFCIIFYYYIVSVVVVSLQATAGMRRSGVGAGHGTEHR